MGGADEENATETFADTLTQNVAEVREQEQEKQAIASKWIAFETKLLDEAIGLFKQRCTREAEAQRLEVCVSFEVLSREIEDFPKRIVKSGNYYVDSWGGGLSSGEAWFYSTHGTSATYSQGEPVLFAEVLEHMMPKFVERLPGLGFVRCAREQGTWKVGVAWRDPDVDPPRKKRKMVNGDAHPPKPDKPVVDIDHDSPLQQPTSEPPSPADKAPEPAEKVPSPAEKAATSPAEKAPTSPAEKAPPSPAEKAPTSPVEKEEKAPTSPVEKAPSPTQQPASPAQQPTSPQPTPTE